MYKKALLLVLVVMGSSVIGMHNRQGSPSKISIRPEITVKEVYEGDKDNEKKLSQDVHIMQGPSCSEEQLFCLGATLEALRCFICGF